MSEADGLICAYQLDGKGGGAVISDWQSLSEDSSDHPRWVHFDWSASDPREWLSKKSGLRPLVQRALLAEDTRPRCTVVDDGILINLRGLNFNSGAEPEDMVSVRIWLNASQIVTSRQRRIMAVQDIGDAISRGQGPVDPASMVVMMSDLLTSRMEPLLDELQDNLDNLEDTVIADTRRELRKELTELRRRTIMLRRYIAPQRDALRQLANSSVGWLNQIQRDRLNEIADRVTRYVEDLDVIRDRAAIVLDELVNLLTERMNQTMYVLSVVAMIFMPLTLFSGMLGMNVGGVPGEKQPWAFLMVSGLFVLTVAIEFWIARRLKWI